jgi:hypothetical protein
VGISPAAHLNLWWLTRPVGVDGTLEWMHKIPDSPDLAGAVFLQALVPGPGSALHPATLTGWLLDSLP